MPSQKSKCKLGFQAFSGLYLHLKGYIKTTPVHLRFPMIKTQLKAILLFILQE